MRRPLILALSCLAVAAAARPAAASPADGPRPGDPPVAVALATGTATALIPLVLGVMHTASVSTNGSRNVGLMVAGAGFTLSPLISHIVLGEYARGAAFSAVPLAAEIAMIALVSVNPDAVFAASTGTRTTFGALFSFGIFSATLGLVDVALARDRWRDRARDRLPRPLRGLTLAPMIGREGGGLLLGGTL